MATVTLRIAENNTGPAIQLTCQRLNTDGVTTTTINLTGCTVNLIIAQNGVQTNTGHSTCSITNATAGQITYIPQSSDFPTAGAYLCDISVTYADGSNEVLYDQLKVLARKRVLSLT